jgi:hypothetical protein
MLVKCLLGHFLGEQDRVDIGQDTSSSNSHAAKELVQFLVVLDSQSNVSRDNTTLLVVAGSVTSEFQDLGAKVLQDSRKVDRGTGTHTGSVLALPKVTADTTDGELKTSLGRSGGGLFLAAAALSFSCD